MAGEEGIFGFGDDPDIPEHLQELLKKLTARALYSEDSADQVADRIRPSEEQLALGPGDLVTVFGSDEDEVAGSSLMVAELLDPQLHAEQYPDWEHRLMNSYLLGRWFSTDTQEGQLGWFPRSRLVPLAAEEWDKFQRWIEDGEPDEHPAPWLLEITNRAIAGLNRSNSYFMPDPYSCERCGSIAVLLEVEVYEKYQYSVGDFSKGDYQGPHGDPKALYSIAKYGEHDKREATLKCLDCGLEADAEGLGRNLWLR